jgi:hypothetical protein
VRLEEVLPALRDGKKVAWRGYVFLNIGDLAMSTLNRVSMYAADDWSIVKEPLTDEQLTAEWERLAADEELADDHASPFLAKAYRICARQLRERKL